MTVPFETQVDFLFQEMNTGNGGNVAGAFNNNRQMSTSQAATEFERLFERSADSVGSSGMTQRINNSERIYNAMTSGQSSGLPSNVQYVYNQAVARGYTPQQASAIAGNLQRESGPNLNPNSVNPNDAGPGLDSYGIAQWNRERLANLQAHNPRTGEVVPNEYVQEGDIVDGEPITAAEASNIRESAAEQREEGSGSSPGRSAYLENPLLGFDTFTYNWAIHIVNPIAATTKSPEEVIKNDQFITLAESGKENEISIQNVTQSAMLTFNRENRNAVANQFDIDLIEVNGMTLYNRLIYAANTLGIENYLEATYILELNFRGWLPGGQPSEIGPFYWTTIATQMPMQHREGASYYQASFVEVDYSAYQRVDYHTRQEISFSASNFGDFLSQFERELNEQAVKEAEIHPYQFYPTEYVLETPDQWASWAFDSVVNAAASRGIQVTGGGGTLNFAIPQGTAITTIIALALFQTRNMRRVYTRSGFALDAPEDAEANAAQLAELTNWISFSTHVEFKNFEPLLRHYQRVFTYRAIKYITPEIIHDPRSYTNLVTTRTHQEDRLRNIFNEDLLKKRYDYLYTGMNTSVLKLDLNFNNAFYTIQAINSGLNADAGANFLGFSLTDQEREIARLKSAANAARAIVANKETALQEVRSLENTLSPFGGSGSGAVATIANITGELESARRALAAATTTLTSRFSEFLQSTASANGRLNPNISNRTGSRFISQTDILDVSGSIGQIQPNTFRYSPVNSLATMGPENVDDPGSTGAAKLGAIEMNLNSLGDLLEIQMDIIGDPYWLGKGSGGAEYLKGGINFFLNVNFPTYEADGLGLMSGVGDFTVKAVYRVTKVTSTYNDGKFFQTLEAFYDHNTNSEMMREELMNGYVAGRSRNNPANTTDERVNETGDSDNEGTGDGGNPELLDPGARGNDIAPSRHSLTGTSTELRGVLEQSADQTGVTMVTTSDGFRGGTSGRHYNGHANDIALYSDGRLLSVANPGDRAIIQNFTERYIQNAKSAGLNPSVGWADHTASRSSWYMNGTVGHYDVSRGLNRGVANAGVWGNGESYSGAPSWLQNLYSRYY